MFICIKIHDINLNIYEINKKFPESNSHIKFLTHYAWIIKNKKTPAVINMSLGGSYSASLSAAVQNCIINNITVVCASGNSGVDAGTSSPANTVGAIAVSAYDENKTRPTWSNYGAVVSSFAPGVSVRAAWGDYYNSYFFVKIAI